MGNAISSSRSGAMDSRQTSMPIQSEMTKNTDSFSASVATSSSIVEGVCCKEYGVFKEMFDQNEPKTIFDKIQENIKLEK